MELEEKHRTKGELIQVGFPMFVSRISNNMTISEFDSNKEEIADHIDKLGDVIQVPDSVSVIQDQIAMESVNKYLKNINSDKGHHQPKMEGVLKPFVPTPIGKNHEKYSLLNRLLFLVFHGSTTVIPNVLQIHRVWLFLCIF